MVADQKQRRIIARELRIIYDLGKLVVSDLDIYELGNPKCVLRVPQTDHPIPLKVGVTETCFGNTPKNPK